MGRGKNGRWGRGAVAGPGLPALGAVGWVPLRPPGWLRSACPVPPVGLGGFHAGPLRLTLRFLPPVAHPLSFSRCLGPHPRQPGTGGLSSGPFLLSCSANS